MQTAQDDADLQPGLALPPITNPRSWRQQERVNSARRDLATTADVDRYTVRERVPPAETSLFGFPCEARRDEALFDLEWTGTYVCTYSRWYKSNDGIMSRLCLAYLAVAIPQPWLILDLPQIVQADHDNIDRVGRRHCHQQKDSNFVFWSSGLRSTTSCLPCIRSSEPTHACYRRNQLSPLRLN